MFNFNPFQRNVKEDIKDLSNKKLIVNKLRCPQNHRCPAVKVCPVDALSQNKYSAPRVDLDKCIKCGKCTKACPTKSLVFE